MDAVKFIKERNRMCKSFGGSCNDCPADKNTCCDAFEWQEELVAIVEEWLAAHPCKTRQDAFLKQYPETALDENGVISICPKALSQLTEIVVEDAPSQITPALIAAENFGCKR